MTDPTPNETEADAGLWLLPINAVLLATLVLLPPQLLRLWRPWDFYVGGLTMGYLALFGIGAGILGGAWAIVHFVAGEELEHRARSFLRSWSVALALVLALGATGLFLEWVRRSTPRDETVLRLLPYGFKLTKALPMPGDHAGKNRFEIAVHGEQGTRSLDRPHRQAMYVGRPAARLAWLHGTTATSSADSIEGLLFQHDPKSSKESRERLRAIWLSSPPQLVETATPPQADGLSVTFVWGAQPLPLVITRCVRGSDPIEDCMLEAR